MTNADPYFMLRRAVETGRRWSYALFGDQMAVTSGWTTLLLPMTGQPPESAEHDPHADMDWLPGSRPGRARPMPANVRRVQDPVRFHGALSVIAETELPLSAPYDQLAAWAGTICCMCFGKPPAPPCITCEGHGVCDHCEAECTHCDGLGKNDVCKCCYEDPPLGVHARTHRVNRMSPPGSLFGRSVLLWHVATVLHVHRSAEVRVGFTEDIEVGRGESARNEQLVVLEFGPVRAAILPDQRPAETRFLLRSSHDQ